MHKQFPLFQTAIDLAHSYWKQCVASGDTVIDATCGNGHDSTFLASLALTRAAGTLHLFDIQQKAVQQTQERLQNLHPDLLPRIHFHNVCHSHIASYAAKETVTLIVYNLGYLPTGDKSITTQAETTLRSVETGLELLRVGGVMSITCYPGHPEGKVEEEALRNAIKKLPQHLWSISWHQWLNRQRSPSLILVQRSF